MEREAGRLPAGPALTTYGCRERRGRIGGDWLKQIAWQSNGDGRMIKTFKKSVPATAVETEGKDARTRVKVLNGQVIERSNSCVPAAQLIRP